MKKNVLLLLTFAAALSALHAAAPSTGEPDSDLLWSTLHTGASWVRAICNFRGIVPEVQKGRDLGEVVPLPAKFTVSVPAGEELIVQQLAEAVKRFRGVAVSAAGEADAFCRFELTENEVPEHDQGYALSIGKEGIRVRSRSGAGLFYGAQTLRNLLRNAAKPELCALTIQDWPDLEKRGFFFSVRWLSPGSFGNLKRAIDAMASLKINWILLELADNFPFEGNPLQRKQTFSREQMREIAEYCRVRHIEFTPALQLWSHALWLAKHPDFAEKMRDGAPNTPWNNRVCPHSPEARELVTRLVNEQIDFFEPERFFIMLDEIYLDRKGKCPKCKADPDLAKTYVEFLKFHEKLLFDRGVRPVVCQDSFLENRWQYGKVLREALDPRDDIVWWNYHDWVPRVGMDLFPRGRLVGHPIAGKPHNVRVMLQAIREHGGRQLALTFWYYSNGGLFTNESETPDSLGGFVNAADYAWFYRSESYADFTYDGTYEMMRRLYPERPFADPAPRVGTPVPLAGAVNTELNADGRFPKLGEGELDALAAMLAAHPEKWRLLTAPGGRYYAAALTGDADDRTGCGRISIPLAGSRAKGFSLLVTASAPDIRFRKDYLSCARYGRKRYKYEPAAFLVLKYEDGEERRIPLRYRKDFTDWNRPFSGFNTRFVVRGIDTDRAYYSLTAFEFRNPRPRTKLASMEFVTARLDGVAPALLAVSLLGATESPFAGAGAEAVDPAAVAARTPARVGKEESPVFRTVHDFANGMGRVTVRASGGELQGELKTAIVDDPTAPHPGKVLAITVPPPKDPRPFRYYRVDISLPCRVKGKAVSVARETKLVCKGGFSHSNEYMVANDGSHWARTIFSPNGKWFFSAYPVQGRGISDKPLKDLADIRIRMLSFFFTADMTQPAEIRIGRLTEADGEIELMPPWRPGCEAEPY